jgi:hypothetical protein
MRFARHVFMSNREAKYLPSEWTWVCESFSIGAFQDKMDFSEWNNLTEKQQKERCQYLDPFDDHDLFKAVETAFWETYGRNEGIESVRCGLGPFIGPYNCIVAEISRKGSTKALPDLFLGFPVISNCRERRV